MSRMSRTRRLRRGPAGQAASRAASSQEQQPLDQRPGMGARERRTCSARQNRVSATHGSQDAAHYAWSAHTTVFSGTHRSILARRFTALLIAVVAAAAEIPISSRASTTSISVTPRPGSFSRPGRDDARLCRVPLPRERHEARDGHEQVCPASRPSPDRALGYVCRHTSAALLSRGPPSDPLRNSLRRRPADSPPSTVNPVGDRNMCRRQRSVRADRSAATHSSRSRYGGIGSCGWTGLAPRFRRLTRRETRYLH